MNQIFLTSSFDNHYKIIKLFVAFIKNLLFIQKDFSMKKFLIISALAILLPASITKCSEDKRSNRGYQIVGVLALAGLGYIIYQNTKPNTLPQTQASKNDEIPNLSEFLKNQKSNPEEDKTKDNNPQKELNLEKPQTNNSTIISSQPTESKPSASNNKPVILQKELSFYDQLYCRIQESEIERLLAEPAFSN